MPFGGPFWIRRPSPDQLERILDDQAGRPFTYDHIGATRSAAPPGYMVEHFRWEIGSEAGSFERAVAALKDWAPQRGAGMQLTPGSPVIAQDESVVLLLPLMGGFVTAAARVVYVVDEPHRYGFAYGTLPHHPEQGEEAFLVERDSGRVSFVIDVFSRPRHPLAWLGRPVARLVQKRTTRRYLEGMLGALREP
ncbi:MAG: DUF1990 domain-containing protein [Actinomycetota bacterium]